jgi:dTMP kinase
LDRFEREELATHELRRNAFLDLAKDEPIRCKVVDGIGDIDDIADNVFKAVEMVLPLLPSQNKSNSKSKAQSKSNSA